MNLTLTVLSFKNQSITEINPVVIDTDGSIGRSTDNTLVLPDTEKFVSRHHATISLENGCYYLSDTSLGGIYINNRETPLHNATERIDNGTLLRVGEYEIAVAIADEQVTDDFPFENEPKTSATKAFLQTDEPLFESEELGCNSLMADNFVRHEELVQTKANEHADGFESGLQVNQSPLFDSYTAPGITPPPAVEIPEMFSFDDFFSGSDVAKKTDLQPTPAANKPTGDDFEAFFGVELSDKAAEVDPLRSMHEISSANLSLDQALLSATANTIDKSTENQHAASGFVTEVDAIEPLIPVVMPKLAVTVPEADSRNDDKKAPVTATTLEKISSVPVDSELFNAFLQGVELDCIDLRPAQHAETLHRIGQMFRKLIDGTVAVLRSRAEFKSLCRVNMTVIRATDNNPLKFTVATDDVLRQLIENKTDGFLGSTAAIDEAFNDIMNHQLAMQAGIQASLTDLLQTFDPKIIEKQFEQGIVLQKKAKCWERYEETYRTTVDDAVENFFGDAFVKAYEKQMSQLISYRRK